MIAKRLLSLAAASALLGWGGHALADDHVVSLTGAVADYQTFAPFTIGSIQFTDSFLPLEGLNADHSVFASLGDTFEVTVSLDGSLTIPASGLRTDVVLTLTGSNFPAENTGVGLESVDFSDHGVAGLHFEGGTTTSNQLAVFNPIFPPDNGPLTFDTITYSFKVSDLAQGATIDGAQLDFTRLDGVPEPGSWALMLVGFGGLGATLRSLRRRAFA